HVSRHGARLRFVALFLVALFRVETVNFDKRASVFANRAQSASNHKRLSCFFRGVDIDVNAVAQSRVRLKRFSLY
ncbi:MAG: IS4 family transposase, partial [Cyanobacteria bacterium J06659_2]